MKASSPASRIGSAILRPAREDDLSAMRLIQGAALRDLVRREGGDPSRVPLTDEPSREMQHLLRTDPTLAWIAAEDGRAVGFSLGFVRGELWFLADLFVHPEAQSKGLGAALLQRCLEAGLRRGARIRAVSASTDKRAQALYIRAAMVPRFPVYMMAGAPARLLELEPPRGARVIRPKPSSALIRQLGDLDEKVWGRRRDREHRFWMQNPGTICLAVEGAGGGLAGYAYCSPEQAGPIAARMPRIQLALLRAIGEALGDQARENFRMLVPGVNAIAMEALLRCGFRIDHAGQFMTSRPFGRFDRYIPSGGTLL